MARRCSTDSLLSLQEFQPPAEMHKFYCSKVTPEEYECQMVSETERAIKELIDHLDNNPDVYKKTLTKRKQEEIANSGVLAMLKMRLLQSLRRGNKAGAEVTEEELQTKLEELKTGMLLAFDYSQAEVKQKRYYTRLAARRAKNERRQQAAAGEPENSDGDGSEDAEGDKENSAEDPPAAGGKKQKMAVPPPPPPLPPPGIPGPSTSSQVPPSSKPAPLGERDMNVDSTSPFSAAKPRRPLRPDTSTSSLSSVHAELLSGEAFTRLKPTKQTRSPGGTPVRRKDNPRNSLRARIFHSNANTPSDKLNSSEPLTTAFLRILDQKFLNVRSPSPNSSLNRSTHSSEFSP